MEMYEIKAQVFRWGSIFPIFAKKWEIKNSILLTKLHSFSSFNSPVK